MKVDWFLLLFLLGFCLDSVVVKPVVMALALLFMIRDLPRLGYKDSPWFYLALPAMELVRFFISRDFSTGHTVTVLIGSLYWIMAWLAFLIIRNRIRRSSAETATVTMELWFIVNLCWSLGQLVMTMRSSGSLNPFSLEDPAFGNSTGDYIRGVFQAPCYLNMFVNTFYAVWFLYRRRWGMALLASLVCCITSTNFANIVFLPVLVLLMFVLRNRGAILTILGSLGIFILFYTVIASGNLKYLRQAVDNSSGNEISANLPVAPTPDTAVPEPAPQVTEPAPAETPQTTPETTNANLAPEPAPAPTAPVEAPPIPDTVAIIRPASPERQAEIFARLSQPNGKVLSWKQTMEYLGSGVGPAIFGAGTGNFSSLLALRMAHAWGAKHSRFYERLPVYIHPDYEQRHLSIMHDLYELPDGYHSARHMPHSFPNQLLGEYGIVGLLCFAFGYVAYFLRRGALRGSFLIILLLAGAYLWFDYLFEYLSVMVFFELFFLRQYFAAKESNPNE